MTDNGRHHSRPSTEEVYQDAKKILEEYLKRKLTTHEGEHTRYARSESYKAASEETLEDHSATVEDTGYGAKGVERSKTMPSSFKAEEESHKVKRAKPQHTDVYSSPETDDDEPHDREGSARQKKSFIKRAKERLKHAFSRDKRTEDDDMDIYDESKEKKKTKKKSKSKSRKVDDSLDSNTKHVKETHAHIDMYMGNGKHSKMDTLAVPDDRWSSNRDSHSSSSRRSSAGKKIMDSLRKSFRKNGKKDMSESKSASPIEKGGQDRSYSRSVSTPDRSSQDSARHGSQLRGKSSTPETNQRRNPEHSDVDSRPNSRRNTNAMMDIHMSQREDNSASRSIQVHGAHVNPGVMQGIASNFAPIADYMGNRTHVDMDIHKTEMTLADDGLWEQCSVRTHTREDIELLPQTSVEADGLHEDQLDSPQDEHHNRDETIDKIVEKLIQIGDNLSSTGSPRRSEGAVGGSPGHELERLSSLERELIEVLREGGDRMSQSIEGPANQFIDGAVKETVYQKFSQTLRQSVGDEVNWNQMALVFHSTKSALKVLGAGSKMATQMKDYTLKYVTEKCATWIVDQGGWESLVSDSDSELD